MGPRTDIPALIDALRGVLSGLPSPAWLVDATGVYRYVNPAGARALGREAKEIVGRRELEVPLPQRLSTAASPWTAPDGEVIGRLVIGTDHEEALRMRRLASVGTLAAAVAHEVNNPLTILLDGLSEMTEEGDDEGAVAGRARMSNARLLATARRALDGGRRVADVLSDLSLIAEDAQREPQTTVDLERILEKTAEEHLPGRLEHEIDKLPRISGRFVALRRFFSRLFGHAARELSGCPEGAVASLTAMSSSEMVRLVLRYPTSTPPRPDPFSPGESGAGVDLILARYVAEVHRGSLEVIREGDVEIVEACLPVGLPTGVYSRDAIPITPIDVVRPRVLIIDDEPLVARALARLLRRDYEVTAVGPERAVETLREDTPDVVITDLMMPFMTGMELVEWIRGERADLLPSVVLMTGGAFTRKGRALVASDEFPLLKKPFDAEQIERTLRRVLRKVERKRKTQQA